MNTKIIALVAIVVIIVAAFVLYNQPASTPTTTTPSVTTPTTTPPASTPSTPPPTTPSVTPPPSPPSSTTGTDATAAAISSAVGDQYSSLMQDQLNSLSTGQPAFNAQVQDSMASDLSQFYYS